MVSFCHNFIGSMKNLISESDKAPTQIERLHPAWAPLSHVTSTCLSIARARAHTHYLRSTIAALGHCSRTNLCHETTPCGDKASRRFV